MDAQATVRRVEFPPASCPLGPQLARTMTSSLLALLAMAGLLICMRRAGGALVEPLSAPVLVGLGGLLTLAALAFRAALPAADRRVSRTTLYLTWAVPSAVGLLWAAGLSLHETSGGGLLGLCGLLLMEEGWSWGRLRKNGAAPRESKSVAICASLAVSQSARSPAGAAVLGESDQEVDETISQQVVRRRQEDGGEAIEGWVRAEFSLGQRHATAHVAICPPLDRVPECFAEQMDGPAAQIKIAQVLPYGVRFEIKLEQPAENASSVAVEFSIHDPPAVA